MPFNPEFRPEYPRKYGPDSNGKWSEPVPDDMLIVTRKHYVTDDNGNQKIEPRTWYYMRPETIDYAVTEGCLIIHAVEKDGSHKATHYPLSEILAFHVKEHSTAYIHARDQYYIQQYGVTYDDYRDMQHRSKHAQMDDALVKKLAKRFGLPEEVIRANMVTISEHELEDDDDTR